MNIVDGLSDSFSLMNNQRLAACSIVQRQRTREHINHIREWMGVPWQRCVRRNGQLDRCKLRLARWVVRIRLPVPRLAGL
jgi:hypothetical protein